MCRLHSFEHVLTTPEEQLVNLVHLLYAHANIKDLI